MKSTPLKIYTSAGGIGDAVCGLYAAAALSQTLADGQYVEFGTDQGHWLSRLAEPGIKLMPNRHMGIDMNARYNEQLSQSRSRKQWYLDNVTKHTGQSLHPVVPRIDRTNFKLPNDHIEKSYVVISPFSAFPERAWPMQHWIKLTWELARQGWRVIVLGGSGDGEAIAENFGPCPGGVSYFYGCEPDWVCDTLLGAALFIGNDSGLTHLAGLLGTPSVAIMAQLPSTLPFSHTDIQVLTPNAPCSPCAWRGERGYVESCGRLGCAAMASVGFSEVYTRAIGILRNQL